MGRRAFTLLELLVVLGIIAVLMGILIPVLRGARDRSNAVLCASNLRQLYMAQMHYADAHGGRLAPPRLPNTAGVRWGPLLQPFVQKQKLNGGFTEPAAVFRCPSDSNEHSDVSWSVSYGLNSNFYQENWQARRDRKTDFSKIIIFGDHPTGTSDYLVSEDKYFLGVLDRQPTWFLAINHQTRPTYRHNRGRLANFVLGDGHVEALAPEQLHRDGGHWYWGSLELDELEWTGSCCGE